MQVACLVVVCGFLTFFFVPAMFVPAMFFSGNAFLVVVTRFYLNLPRVHSTCTALPSGALPSPTLRCRNVKYLWVVSVRRNGE